MEKLIDLISQFDSGDIALPIMQREYVWRPRKVECLLDSLYKRWPIGSFYLWRPNAKQPTKGHPVNGLAAYPARYLLDGQQRLASLSRAIKDACSETILPPPGKQQNQAISWRAFFDVINEAFILKGRTKSVENRIENDDPQLIALSDLILEDDHDGLKKESNIGTAVARLAKQGYEIADSDAKRITLRTRLQRVASMLNVDVLCHEIETAKLATTSAKEVEVAIEIFQRLNSGGMHLSAGDVAAAQLAQETTCSILGPMREFARDSRCLALGINFVFLTRALVTLRCGTARLSKPPL